jgi:MbtH protein
MNRPDATATAAANATAAAVLAVVVNDEGQYSLWPLWRPLPIGWQDTGVHGDRETCLAHVEAVWTDQRPRSLAARLDRPTA